MYGTVMCIQKNSLNFYAHDVYRLQCLSVIRTPIKEFQEQGVWDRDTDSE